ncbi:MAG: hypothetical protein A2X81_08985 [Desulfobacterales bacterium GWB2_56_26]|nr:MAG: hypothetical protein A2X81_08985 [Desulfobacterales bacterium GWB2_56_26]
MATYRMILAVVFSSFLALATVSCDGDKPPEKTGEKKVEQPTQQPTQQPGGTQQPGVTQEPGQTTGEKPAEPGAPKSQ